MLKNAGEPVNGDCEMAFRLYDADAPGGSQVGGALAEGAKIYLPLVLRNYF